MMAELFGRYTGYCKGQRRLDAHSRPRQGHTRRQRHRRRGALHRLRRGPFGQAARHRPGLRLLLRRRLHNQGTFHESLNMASIWKLPIIFVCENNHYGISMSQDRHQAIKDVADRGAAYNIPGISVDGNDPMAVYEAASEAVARARAGKGPTLLECKTYRQHGHFEGDPAVYKPKEEQAAWMEKDPMPRFAKFLVENGVMTREEVRRGRQAGRKGDRGRHRLCRRPAAARCGDRGRGRLFRHS